MKKKMMIIMAGLLLISLNVFADDVSIDSTGNVKTGVANTNAELEVTGGSAEGAIRGMTSGTGAVGVYGVRTDNSNYGILGSDNYGVYGNSTTGYAGYFQGNAKVTGNLTVDGVISVPNINASSSYNIGGSPVLSTPSYNTFIGQNSGYSNSTGRFNTFIGLNAGSANTTGESNVYIGQTAGSNNTQGVQNTFIGSNAGYTNTGYGNVFIGAGVGYSETGSNKLYIDNSSTSSPLIYGDFSTDTLAINGKLDVSGNVSLSGTHLIYNSANGVIDWGSAGTGDLYFRTLSTQGDPNSFTNRMIISNNGNVGIGTISPSQKLTVAGTIESTSGGVKFPDGTVQTTASAPSWHQILPAAERFVLVMNNNEAVLDKETGLVWEKSPSTFAFTWEYAIHNCPDLNVGGRKGWHLPTVEQLASLVDPSVVGYPKLPSGHPFTNVQSSIYWSATTGADTTTYAMVVHFGYGDGDVGSNPKTDYHYAWCVRGGQSHDGQ